MKTLPAALQDHLASGATTLCNAWRIDRADGTVLGFTDHDGPLTIAGVVYSPIAGLDRAEIDETLGLAVDNAEVVGALTDDRISADDLERGLFDNATVTLMRLNWAAPDQHVTLFTGTVGEITRHAPAYRAEVRGPAHALDRPTGRIYQHLCDAALGDGRCGVAIAGPAFSATVTATASDGRRTLQTADLSAFAAGWFDRGRLEWLSGENADTGAEIKRHTTSAGGATLELWLPAPGPIAAGDTCRVIAGCDKRFVTCRDRFQNAANFRGFPHMPGNDWVTSYPVLGDRNDGSPVRTA